MENFNYTGESELFLLAKNWKAYWSKAILPFMGERILELGAGIGATARLLNKKPYQQWLALEPDSKLCAIMEKEKGELPSSLEIRHGTRDQLLPDELFDVALYIDVLEHIEDDRLELINISRHIVQNGYMIILVPAHQQLYTPFDEKIGHFRRYNKQSLINVLPSNFVIVKSQYLDSVGLLASLANKWFLKSSTPTKQQIIFWDSVLVRLSTFIDPLLRYKLGKSILMVLQKQ